MKTLEYTFREEEKKTWGEGPWNDEPDKMQWQDEETGLPCLVVRGPMGQWCGYVGIAEGHPDFEKNPFDDDLTTDVYVHGGLTFSGFCVEDGKERGVCHLVEPGENDRVWWLGFDCAHMNDYVPKVEATLKEVGHEWPTNLQDDPLFGKFYRTIGYARIQTRELAKQLAEIV